MTPPLDSPASNERVAFERGCYVIMELMQAYERRIRSDCTTPEQLAAEPWRCAEYIKAERYLVAAWTPGQPHVETRDGPLAASDAFEARFKREPTSQSDSAWMNGWAAGRRKRIEGDVLAIVAGVMCHSFDGQDRTYYLKAIGRENFEETVIRRLAPDAPPQTTGAKP